MYGHRRHAIPIDRGSRSGTWRTELRSSESTRTLVAEAGSTHPRTQSSVRVLPHDESQDIFHHDLRGTLKGAHYRQPRILNIWVRQRHHHKLRQFILAMIAAMSTRTRADLIKPNQTQNQTQKSMIVQMTTLHQGLVGAHEVRKEDKERTVFRLCEFPPPPDRRGPCQSGAPQQLHDVESKECSHSTDVHII